jgi:hypothetical protein
MIRTWLRREEAGQQQTYPGNTWCFVDIDSRETPGYHGDKAEQTVMSANWAGNHQRPRGV